MHDNVIGMQLADGLAHSKTNPVSAVLLAGDLTNRGTDLEARLFISLFKAGQIPVVAVGGNHEDAPAMRDFARAGYHVLEGTFASAGGVTVYGVSDPQAEVLTASTDPVLIQQQDAALLERWKTFTQAPQVLIVHDASEASSVIAYARDHGQRLTVIHGHDHVASVHQEGSVTIVDTGTGGGGGYGELGADPTSEYTFQLLDFSQGADPRLLSVTTMRYTGLQGKSSAEFTPIGQ